MFFFSKGNDSKTKVMTSPLQLSGHTYTFSLVNVKLNAKWRKIFTSRIRLLLISPVPIQVLFVSTNILA